MKMTRSPRAQALALTFSLATATFAATTEEIRLPSPQGAKPGFTQMNPDKAGFSFGPATITNLKKVPVHVSNPGLAAGDIDGDGLTDLFVCRVNGSHSLFRNLGHWKFQNVTAQSGLKLDGRAFLGSVFSDVDGDGDDDLMMLSLTTGSALFLNNGKGKFTEDLKFPWIKSEEGGEVSAAISDIDGDGDLDIYVTRYRQELLRYTMSRSDYNDLIDRALIALKSGQKPEKQFMDRFFVYSEYQGQEIKYRFEERGQPDALYLNNGDGSFSNAANQKERFKNERGEAVGMPVDWGLAAAFRDIDQDGDPDLYVCNDFLSPDRFWINDGTGHFQMIDRLALRRTSWFSMGVDFADINRDGHDDFFVVDMLSRSHTRRKRQMGEMSPTPIVIGQIDDRPQFMQNTLLLNRGDGTYSEIAQLAGLKASEWSWCPMFIDIDLDGYEDVIVNNGMRHDFMDADSENEFEKLGGLTREQSIVALDKVYPTLNTPNLIFRNRGDLTFEEKSKDWGFTEGAVSGGLTYADFDNDGDLDVIINNLDEYPLEVYRNDSPAPRISVKLHSDSRNTRGIGARIRVTGGPFEQTQEIIAGGIYSSGAAPMRTFAAFDPKAAMKIEVKWRDGRRSVIENAKANHAYIISDAGASQPDPRKPAVAETVFEDQTASLNHHHTETPFDDFALQPLLPNRLSQLGPGVSWFDIDQDGDDDLIVASGGGGNIHVLQNDGSGGFKDFKSPQLFMETTSIVGFINHEGEPTVFVGMSNYESGKTEHPSAQGFYFKEGKRWHLQDGIPHVDSSTGPVSLGDVDGDGDLDLFVGGRIISAKYPAPASSRVFLYDQGKWLPDAVNTKSLEKIGLVSGATFGDIDGDGDADLILALEWGPIKVLLNENGKLTDATAKLGLASYTGWWNGVALGDFDNDGRLDIVASNWGRNSKYEHAYSLLKPLQIYYGDLDENGVLDVVEAHYDKQMKMLVPERGRSCSSRAMPFIGHRNTSYAQFGARSLHEVYGSCIETARVVEANTLTHMVFLNRGARFDGRALPIESQFAPGFHVAVSDYDGDGNEDIFMSQNFFSVQLETPRNDGGRAIWLKGDGTGSFTTVPGHVSGVQVYGEQRGAALADYDRDGRVDLVVTQNGALTRLFRNRGAQPGLRVSLEGPAANPQGIGASIRLRFGDKSGPLRNVAAGSGYWSQDSAAHILATPTAPSTIEVRWPDGRTTATPVPPNAQEIVVKPNGEVRKAPR